MTLYICPGPCNECVMSNGIGFNPHPTDCTKFTQCYFGDHGEIRAVYRECPFEMFYDKEKIACVPATQTVCEMGRLKGQVAEHLGLKCENLYYMYIIPCGIHIYCKI